MGRRFIITFAASNLPGRGDASLIDGYLSGPMRHRIQSQI